MFLQKLLWTVTDCYYGLFTTNENALCWDHVLGQHSAFDLWPILAQRQVRLHINSLYNQSSTLMLQFD